MQQTILPQAPAKTSQSEVGAAKSQGRKDAEAGESRFDELSRAEQKRMDAKRAERRDQADAAQERKAADRADEKAEASNARPEKNDTPTDQKQVTDSESPARPSSASDTKDSEADDALVVAEPLMPLTFANLQSLYPAAANQSSAGGPESLASNMALTGNQAASGLIKGLPGQSSTVAGSTTLAPGMQLTDLLAGATSAESARPVDPTSLLTTPRFQGVMETAAQQAAQPGKLAADANIPLRGYTTSVDVPVGQAEWGDKVMGKLSWLTARNMSVAEIHLTPPDMGPMEVKVKVHNDQASVTVHAANPVVREQLEQHSHRLRDMLGEQGLSLGQFDVSDQGGQQAGGESGEAGEGDGRSSGGSSLASHDADAESLSAGQLDLGWRGEVDVFA